MGLGSLEVDQKGIIMPVVKVELSRLSEITINQQTYKPHYSSVWFIELYSVS